MILDLCKTDFHLILQSFDKKTHATKHINMFVIWGQLPKQLIFNYQDSLLVSRECASGMAWEIMVFKFGRIFLHSQLSIYLLIEKTLTSNVKTQGNCLSGQIYIQSHIKPNFLFKSISSPKISLSGQISLSRQIYLLGYHAKSTQIS